MLSKRKTYIERAKDIKARMMIDQGYKLEPRCMPPKEKNSERRQQIAVTNRGQLVPCCWMDQKVVLQHPDMQKMLKVSNVADYDTIEEILLTDEWQEFAKNLEERNIEKIMPVCITHCVQREGRDRQKIETYTLGKETKEINAYSGKCLVSGKDYWKK